MNISTPRIGHIWIFVIGTSLALGLLLAFLWVDLNPQSEIALWLEEAMWLPSFGVLAFIVLLFMHGARIRNDDPLREIRERQRKKLDDYCYVGHVWLEPKTEHDGNVTRYFVDFACEWVNASLIDAQLQTNQIKGFLQYYKKDSEKELKPLRTDRPKLTGFQNAPPGKKGWLTIRQQIDENTWASLQKAMEEERSAVDEAFDFQEFAVGLVGGSWLRMPDRIYFRTMLARTRIEHKGIGAEDHMAALRDSAGA